MQRLYKENKLTTAFNQLSLVNICAHLIDIVTQETVRHEKK